MWFVGFTCDLLICLLYVQFAGCGILLGVGLLVDIVACVLVV